MFSANLAVISVSTRHFCLSSSLGCMRNIANLVLPEGDAIVRGALSDVPKFLPFFSDMFSSNRNLPVQSFVRVSQSCSTGIPEPCWVPFGLSFTSDSKTYTHSSIKVTFPVTILRQNWTSLKLQQSYLRVRVQFICSSILAANCSDWFLHSLSLRSYNLEVLLCLLVCFMKLQYRFSQEWDFWQKHFNPTTGKFNCLFPKAGEK